MKTTSDKVHSLEHQLGVVTKRMETGFLDVEKQLEVVSKRQAVVEGDVFTLKEDHRNIRHVTNSLVDHFKTMDNTLSKAVETLEKQGRTDTMRKTFIAIVVTTVLLLLFLR